MKGRQVGFVLIVLVAIGLAGLIVRVISAESDEVVLSGLLPIAPDVTTRITIHSNETGGEARLVRIGDLWTVENAGVFVPKLNAFWAAVFDIDGAQLIGTNPDNHERIGVAEDQGTLISFFLEDFIQEQFILGKWTPGARLCYLRRPGKPEVYGIECPGPASDVFDPEPDGWRDPIVVAIPRDEVESISFVYPDEEFVVKISDDEWVVAKGGEEKPADLFLLNNVLTVLEVVFAGGFADEAEAQELKFDLPDAFVRVVTRKGANTPTTSLRFLEREDGTYYLKTPTKRTVFIMDSIIGRALLLKSEDLIEEE